MAFMEKYLNKMIECPETRKSKYLEGFLTIVNEDQFNKLKKESEKLSRPNKLSQMTTITG